MTANATTAGWPANERFTISFPDMQGALLQWRRKTHPPTRALGLDRAQFVWWLRLRMQTSNRWARMLCSLARAWKW